MFQTAELFGRTFFLYNVFNNFAIIAQLLLVISLLKDYKQICTFPILADKYFNKKRKNDFLHSSIFMFLEVTICLLLLTTIGIPLGKIISMIFLGSKDANFFPNIYFIPVAVILIAIIIKVSPLKFLDISALIVNIGLIFYKIACFCEGCCYGIEYPTPFYNHTNERYEIPIQLIELTCAIIIFIVLLIMRKRKKRAGFMYPTFILSYCGSRFCSEFLRDDYPAVIGKMTGYHIECLIGLVLGLIYLLIVFKYGEKITAYFEAKNDAFLGRKLEEYKKKQRAKSSHNKNNKRYTKK